MTMIGADLGGDERVIALSHVIRLLIVVSFLPVLFRAISGATAPVRWGAGCLSPPRSKHVSIVTQHAECSDKVLPRAPWRRRQRPPPPPRSPPPPKLPPLLSPAWTSLSSPPALRWALMQLASCGSRPSTL